MTDIDPFRVDGVSWRQRTRDIASGYGLALRNTTLDFILWNLTAYPVATEQQVTRQLHNTFRIMSRRWALR